MKMNRISPLFILSSLSLLATTLTGCGGKNKKKIEGQLKIAIMEGGFGVEWLDKMIEGYKQVNPDVTILKPEYFLGDEALNMIKSGPEDNDVDLFIAGPVFAGDMVEQGETIVKGYDPILEDLTDVFESNAYGDSIKISEKMYESVSASVRYRANPKLNSAYQKYNNKAYSLPWAYGPGGMIFNKNFFDANPSYKVPNTTDELYSLVQTIYADHVQGKPDNQKVYPVIWAGANASAYWRYLTSVWITQYDGIDAWERFLRTEDESGNFSDTVFNTEGRLKALQVLANIIQDKYSYPNSIGTSHTDSQIQFMRGKAAMLPAGDWTENETRMSDSFGTKGPDDIFMIKTPIISALGTKLGISDSQLSSIVTAVDAGQNSLDGIAQSVFDAVKTARSYTSNCDFNHNIVIPSYATSKDAAKDFIKYMYSNDGLRTFMNYAHGFMPMKFEVTSEEYNKMSPFMQSTYTIGKNSTMIAMDFTKSPILYRNNLQLFNLAQSNVECELGKKNDPETAESVNTKSYEYVHNNWNRFKRVGGVS